MLTKKMRTKRGFTMVELLVVIIIIAVLVAIALPKYFAAIYTARVRSCQANMKIINTAAQAYFAQNKTWPTEVANMLDPSVPGANVPAGMKGGQLTEVPVCPFDTVDTPHPYLLVAVHEDPADVSTPIVGYVVDWNGHFADANWQSATVHEP
jgi:prepilin-type N-terminal cleavage/methylation domain-containing protein